jgi:Methylamine utilisation protein MauE
VGVVARVVVGVVLLLAGALKLHDPGWPAAASALGTPAPLVPAVAPVEIALGSLVAVGVATPWSVAAALLLLVGFTGVLVRALLLGTRPVCACFGGMTSRPIGLVSVVRNLVLIALATVALTA